LIVVDATSVVELLLQTPVADRIAERIARERNRVHAPQLVDVESINALRLLVFRREVQADRADLAVLALETLSLRRWSHRKLRPRIWALRHNVSACDATYVALAERLGCRVLTRDGPLSRTPGLEDRFELI